MPTKSEISASATEGKREAEAAAQEAPVADFIERFSSDFSLCLIALEEAKDGDAEKLNQISGMVDELRAAVRLIPGIRRDSIDDQESRVRSTTQEERICALEAQEKRIRHSILTLFGI